MIKFKVGDEVRIRKDSEYYLSQEELLEVGKVIEQNREDSCFEYRVRGIKTHYSNVYNGSDLELVDTQNETISERYVQQQTKEVSKMEKPNTKLEKNACQVAKEEVIKAEIKKKAETYTVAMEKFLVKEGNARVYREEADELRDILGISDKEMEELF